LVPPVRGQPSPCPYDAAVDVPYHAVARLWIILSPNPHRTVRHRRTAPGRAPDEPGWWLGSMVDE
jgi:hypothetical protein